MGNYKVVRVVDHVIDMAEEGFEDLNKAVKFAKGLLGFSSYSAVVDKTPLMSSEKGKGVLIFWESNPKKRPFRWDK